MKYIKKIIISITFILLAIGGLFTLPQYTQATTNTQKKVVFIGSSSFRIGCNQPWGFINLLKKELGNEYQLDCKQTSKSGEKWDYFLERWYNAAKGKGYDDLVIFAGLNGVNSDSGLSSYKENLNIIFKEAKKEGVRVIVMSAQPYTKSNYAKYIPKINEWAKNHPSTDIFIDVYHAVDLDNDGKQDKQFVGDGLHLNKAGNKVQFELLMNQAYGGGTNTVVPDGGETVVVNAGIFSEIESILQKPQTKIAIPGLSFTDPEKLLQSEEPDGSKYYYFPFIGEYIASVYKYGIIIIAIISIIMIINSGLVWIMSGGSAEQINKARAGITRSIIGLFIAVGSYTLLYTINPELVEFRNLRVMIIKGIPLEGKEYIDANTYRMMSGGKKVITKEQAKRIAVDASEKLGLDKCIFDVIIQKESGGAVNAIGHDENVTTFLTRSRIEFIKRGHTYSGKEFTKFDLNTLALQLKDPDFKKANPDIVKNHYTSKIKNDDGPKYVDISKIVPPDYGIDWDFTNGHGFGLAQIQVFKDSFCDKENKIRGRTIGNVCYTIPELLDPVKNMEASTRLFKINLDRILQTTTDKDEALQKAFTAYNGGSGYGESAMKLYNECKSK